MYSQMSDFNLFFLILKDNTQFVDELIWLILLYLLLLY